MSNITPKMCFPHATVLRLEEIKQINFIDECITFYVRELPLTTGTEEANPYCYKLVNEDGSIRTIAEIGTDGEKVLMDNFNKAIMRQRPGYVLSRAVFFPRRPVGRENYKTVHFKHDESEKS